MLLQEFVREAVVKKYGDERGSDKELAGAVHSALDGKESVQFITVQGRISKLLNGNPGGRDFFFDDKQPHRLGVLADALGTDPAKLRELDEQLVLVVDPRFSPDVAQFLHERTAHANTAFCVSAPVEGDNARSALRDEAKRYRNAKVLLSVAEDEAFFEGATIATARHGTSSARSATLCKATRTCTRCRPHRLRPCSTHRARYGFLSAESSTWARYSG